MQNDEIVSKLLKVFDGRDPLTEAHSTMTEMDHKELISLVLIAANKIGTILKGGDYEDGMDAVVHVCHGIDMIFSSYDETWLHQQANVNEVGNA